MGKISIFITSFILCSALWGAAGYFFYFQPDQLRIEQLGRDLESAVGENKLIREGQQRSERTLEELRSISEKQLGSIQKLRELFRVLEDHFNSSADISSN